MMLPELTDIFFKGKNGDHIITDTYGPKWTTH